MNNAITNSLTNLQVTYHGLEPFQQSCSRRRQSAHFESRRTIWRELTFAATRLIELLQSFPFARFVCLQALLQPLEILSEVAGKRITNVDQQNPGGTSRYTGLTLPIRSQAPGGSIARRPAAPKQPGRFLWQEQI